MIRQFLRRLFKKSADANDLCHPSLRPFLWAIMGREATEHTIRLLSVAGFDDPKHHGQVFRIRHVESDRGLCFFLDETGKIVAETDGWAPDAETYRRIALFSRELGVRP